MLADWLLDDMQAQPVPPAVRQLTDTLRQRHGKAALAVLFYGSCRRGVDATEGLADLLVIVRRYRDAHGMRPAAAANRLLPPNVYYLQAGSGEAVPRCKYAMVSLEQFARRCRRGLDAYFWARFAQPVQIAWCRDRDTAARLAAARADAVRRFAQRATPLMPADFDEVQFWARALKATYACELRPEPPGNTQRLVQADRAYYQAISGMVLPETPGVSRTESLWCNVSSGPRRLGARLEWGCRRVWGKCLNLARLFKAAGTFTNGIDYLLWKVERHSGVRVEATPRMRRHPRLAAWGLAWRLWRRGAFR